MHTPEAGQIDLFLFQNSNVWTPLYGMETIIWMDR